MVSFRVSPEEYRGLCQACANQGVRSVSELARVAVRLLTAGNNVSVTFENRLLELQARVQLLTMELERISQRVGHGPSQTSAGASGSLKTRG